MVCRNQNPITKVQRMFRTKYGRNAKTPATSQIRMWLGTFKTKHTVSPEKKRRKKVDCERITQCYNANPKQSLRRVANQLNLSCSAVRDTLKKAGYRNYRPQIVQALKEDDLTSRVSFANFILGKVNGEFPNFLQTIIFSDEAVFHLEGGVNKHNSSHWSTSNPHWIVEYSTRIHFFSRLSAPNLISILFRYASFYGRISYQGYMIYIKYQILNPWEHFKKIWLKSGN